MYVDFPVSLPDPNSTTSSIEDASIELNIYQASPKPQDLGIYASEYGGYFESDLPGNDWEYSFSHLTLEVDIDFDSIQNLSLGRTWRDNLVSELETTLNVDFLQYESDTYGSGLWSSEYRAFPQDYDIIWDLVLDPFPCGNTTLLPKEEILESDNKAIRINANWDDTDGDGDEEEYRWEYTADVELYRENLLSLGKDSNTIYFRDLLNYEGDFQMPTWVNESNLDIYLYKGAEISEVSPSPYDDVQDRGHIERELDYEGNMNGFLPESANFVFTDGQESEPILNSLFSVDDTTVNYGEEITVTGIITNVGGQTAYDIDVFFSSFSDFNLTSGETTYEIESLESGESYTTSATLVCDDNGDDISNFQMYYYYDATANLELANHWSRPQFTGDRFYGTSNQIRIFQNDVDPEPWMVVKYNIDNIGPQVGEEINITATITNIGDVYASYIQWDFNPFPNYDYYEYNELGINLTDDSGIIERIDPSESVNVSTSYTVDAYNRYFGGNCGYSCDLTFYNQNETNPIDMDSYNYGDNEAGSSVYSIYPSENQIFGPVLIFNEEISASSSEAGALVTIDFTISNNGSTPAYNVYVHTDYYDGGEYFYLEYLEGFYPDFSLGTLYPDESLNYRTRFTLLKNTSIANLSVTPYITYSVRQDSETCFITPGQISEGSNKMSGQTIWMIVAIAAIAVIVGESFVFYKKVKM
ncbi:MAG: hypothetical protein ACTSRK_20355 [Promethearchaeota archaeon]